MGRDNFEGIEKPWEGEEYSCNGRGTRGPCELSKLVSMTKVAIAIKVPFSFWGRFGSINTREMPVCNIANANAYMGRKYIF